jgi:hypothetical protein
LKNLEVLQGECINNRKCLVSAASAGRDITNKGQAKGKISKESLEKDFANSYIAIIVIPAARKPPWLQRHVN